MRTVLIAAGGTGGHVFPALAVANQLKQEGVHVHWIGSGREIEQRVVVPNYPFTCLSLEAFRGKGWLVSILFPFRFFRSALHVWRVFSQVRPDVVLTMGSFVSAPTGLISWLRRTPLIIHEQNAVPGMVNRLLARLASRVLEAFPNTFTNTKKVFAVGNPLRLELLSSSDGPAVCRKIEMPLRILVLGGSQGASFINSLVLDWAIKFASNPHLVLWHQAGESGLAQLQTQYDHFNIKVRLDSFISDMLAAYQWADLVICRAGAMTVAEICAMAKPAIFIPFPAAVDDHQYHNAKPLVDDGAAMMLRQSECSVEKLQALVEQCISDPEQLAVMSTRLYQHAKLTATEDVLSHIVAAYDQKNKRLADVG